MNSVQNTYTPPRLAALVVAALIFATYYGVWRPTLISPSRYEYPAPLFFEIISAVVVGYGTVMVWWLVRKTKGQVRDTFRPTRGRIIATVALFLVTPVGVVSYLPFIIAGLLPLVVFNVPPAGIAAGAVALLLIYPLAAMIVRHTYERRWLRFGLFALSFWTAYCGLTLITGVNEFRL